MNLLSILGLLANQGTGQPVATAPTPGVTPAQPPAGSGGDWGGGFMPMLAQMGSMGSSITDNALPGNESARLIAGNKQRAELEQQRMVYGQHAAKLADEQRKTQVMNQGVQSFEADLRAGNLDEAELKLPHLLGMGVSAEGVGKLEGLVKSLRERKATASLEEFKKENPDLFLAIIEGRMTAKDAFAMGLQRQESKRQDVELGIKLGERSDKRNAPLNVAPDHSLVKPNADGTGYDKVYTAPSAPVKPPAPTKVTADQIADLNRAGFRATEETKFSDIPAEVWTKVETQKRQARIDDKQAIAEAIRAGQGAQRVRPTEMSRIFDAKTLAPAPPGMTYDQLDAAIGDGRLMVADKGDISIVKELRGYGPALDDMENLAKKLLAVAPGENLTKAIKLYGDRTLGQADARVLEGYKKTLGLAIGAYLNRGRPTEADADAARALMPDNNDTVQSALAKMSRLRYILESRSASLLGRDLPAPPSTPQPSIDLKSGKKIVIPQGLTK